MAASRRDFGSSSFGDDSGLFVDKTPDPMAGITNLVDAMLVFACGLMLALVSYWNIDLPDITKVMQQKEMTEVNNIEVTDDQLNADGTLYNEKGTVFEDPSTGQLYMLQENTDNGGADSATSEE